MCFNEALWVCPLLVARHDHVSKFGGCAVYLDCLLKRGVVLVAVYVEPCCDSGRAESGGVLRRQPFLHPRSLRMEC